MSKRERERERERERDREREREISKTKQIPHYKCVIAYTHIPNKNPFLIDKSYQESHDCNRVSLMPTSSKPMLITC